MLCLHACASVEAYIKHADYAYLVARCSLMHPLLTRLIDYSQFNVTLPRRASHFRSVSLSSGTTCRPAYHVYYLCALSAPTFHVGACRCGATPVLHTRQEPLCALLPSTRSGQRLRVRSYVKPTLSTNRALLSAKPVHHCWISDFMDSWIGCFDVFWIWGFEL